MLAQVTVLGLGPDCGNWPTRDSEWGIARRLLPAADRSACRRLLAALIGAGMAAGVVFLYSDFVAWGFGWVSFPGCLFRAVSAVRCTQVAP